MAAARRIGVRQFVDEHQLRPPFEDRVDVHLAEAVALMLDLSPWDDLVAVDKRLGLAAAVRLDHADDDIDPGLAPVAAVGQHLPRLSDAGRGAEEDFQTAAAFLRRLTQKGLG